MSASDVLYYGSVIPRLEGYDGGLMAADEGSATSSLVLLERVRAGDPQALNRLVQRYLAPLTRWAAGRLPGWARDLSDTDDLVQDALMRTVRQLDRFEPRRDGALHAYLRSAVMNRIRDEIRRCRADAKVGRASHRCHRAANSGNDPFHGVDATGLRLGVQWMLLSSDATRRCALSNVPTSSIERVCH